jgi:hypothetical protein
VYTPHTVDKPSRIWNKPLLTQLTHLQGFGISHSSHSWHTFKDMEEAWPAVLCTYCWSWCSIPLDSTPSSNLWGAQGVPPLVLHGWSSQVSTGAWMQQLSISIVYGIHEWSITGCTIHVSWEKLLKVKHVVSHFHWGLDTGRSRLVSSWVPVQVHIQFDCLCLNTLDHDVWLTGW